MKWRRDGARRFNLPDTCIRNMMPTTTRTSVAAIGYMLS